MKLKRKICLVLIALLFIFGMNISYAETITLEEIANEINTSAETAKMKDDGIILTATYTEDSITMKIQLGQTKSYTSTYTLDGNILTNSSFQSESEALFSQILLATINNLNENEGMYSTIQNKLYEGTTPYANCTLEKDGIQFDVVNKTIKMDITKTLEPIKYEKTYFRVDDYDESLSSIARCKRINNCVVAYISGMWVFWTNDATFENLDDSVQGLIEYIDGDKNDDITPEKVMEYFRKNYSSFALGSKTFKGFEIGVSNYGDLLSTATEENAFQFMEMLGLGIHKDAKLAYIEINGAEIREAVNEMNAENANSQNNNNNNNNENNNTTSNVPTLNNDTTNKPATSENTNNNTNTNTNNATKKYPNAGLQNQNLVYALFALIVASAIGIIVLKVKKD